MLIETIPVWIALHTHEETIYAQSTSWHHDAGAPLKSSADCIAKQHVEACTVDHWLVPQHYQCVLLRSASQLVMRCA